MSPALSIFTTDFLTIFTLFLSFCLSVYNIGRERGRKDVDFR
jgi:hypothetical protein